MATLRERLLRTDQTDLPGTAPPDQALLRELRTEWPAPAGQGSSAEAQA